MSTFAISSGDNSTGPFGSGTGEGFADNILGSPLVTSGVGGSTPSPALVGGQNVVVCCFISQGGGINNFAVTIAGTLAQSFFTSISFVNRLGVTETYLTSTATLSQASGFTTWTWTALQTFPFTNSANYTMTVLGAVDPVFVTVPGVVSETLAQATADIQAAALVVGTVTGANDPATPGTIISQSPAGGAQAVLGSAVALTESFGPILLQATFVPANNFKAIMVANPGTINPRIYPPHVDTTVRVKP